MPSVTACPRLWLSSGASGVQVATSTPPSEAPPLDKTLWVLAGLRARARRRARGRRSWARRRTGLHAQQLDLEHQRGVGRNDRGPGVGVLLTRRAVGERRRDDQLALAARRHPRYALIPAGYDLTLADGEREGLVAAPARIEERAVGEPSRVLDDDDVVGVRDRAGALAQVDVLETVRKRHRREAIACVEVVHARCGVAVGRAFVGHGPVVGVWIGIPASRRDQEGKRGGADEAPPHVAAMSIEVMRSPA